MENSGNKITFTMGAVLLLALIGAFVVFTSLVKLLMPLFVWGAVIALVWYVVKSTKKEQN